MPVKMTGAISEACYAVAPREATKEMAKASSAALKTLIEAIPEHEREKRWGKPLATGYRIPGLEKAAVRYAAMIQAGDVAKETIT